MAYTFVLVHGAWHGGWCWQRVADRLRNGGHKVFTPTLTGLGERSHLLRTGIDIGTHITDVVNVLKWERLSDVVLCGHSYGGFVISGVAEQMASAIRSIVFLDAFVPNDGDTTQNLTSAAVQEAIRAALRAARSACRRGLRNSSASMQPTAPGSTVSARRSRSEPSPIRFALTGAREKIARKTYIRAKSYANPGFDRAVAPCKPIRPGGLS